MQEQSKREEPLSEELLEGITGGTGGASGSGRTQGPTSFLDCRQCRSEARRYGAHIRERDYGPVSVDIALRDGHPAIADAINHMSGQSNQKAQESYQKMEAHGHPDFPAALRQQRQNYNPPL